MSPNVFKFLWKHLSKVKYYFFTVLFCVFCGELFFRLFIYAGAEIADLLASSLSKEEIMKQSLVYVCYGFGFLVIHRFSYDITSFIEAKFLPVYYSKMAKDIFSHTSKHSTSFFAEEMAGNVSSKVKTMLDNSYAIYYNILWGFIYPIFALSVILFMVLKVHLVLALIMLSMNLIYITFIYFINKKIAPYSEFRSKRMSEAQGVLVDSISNVSTVKSFSSFLFEKKNYFNSVKKAARAEQQEIIKFGVLFIYQGIFRLILQMTFYALPLWYWYKNEISVGDFVLIMSLSHSLSNLYLNFTHTFMDFFKLYGGINDGLKLLTRPYEVVDAPDAKPLKVKKANIVFDNVNYHYKDSNELFKNFNLEIKAGEKVGLVGHSGSGKSTLIKILSRYYDIQGGKILVDNQDISKVTQDSLRKIISLIPQDPSLFNRTIMENIRYGDTKSSDKQVFEAAKKAYMHDFIMNLPQGYDSKVGERGVMLSGGERQRIAIARAILKNAPILILDEATSALDSESEKFIHDSMRNLMKGKTVIAIAHRLSTLKEMDKIVVMDKGKIIEMGTHLSLLRKKGRYHNFYEMQSQGFLNL